MSESDYDVVHINYTRPIHRFLNLVSVTETLPFKDICFLKIVCEKPMKKLKKLTSEELLNTDIGITKIAVSCADLSTGAIHYLEFPPERVFQLMKILRESDVIVSHNMTYQKMLLDNLCHRAELPLFEPNEKQTMFCTLEHGTPLNDQHVYLGGKKQKKYISLDKLHDVLFDEIALLETNEDYLQCVEDCFVRLLVMPETGDSNVA